MIIATGYGESAEVYYETVRDLNARGWSVWVIEPHGQGGSGRFPGQRDVGRSAGFDKDAAAIRWLVENVIRPSEEDEVVLAAHGSAILPALLLLEGGFRRVDRLAAWSPDLSSQRDPERARLMRRIGLGWTPGGGKGWRRPRTALTTRPMVSAAWQVANPDLRMGSKGWSWLAAQADAAGDAGVALPNPSVAKQPMPHLTQPIFLSGPAGSAGNLCDRLPRCTFRQAQDDEHLGPDATRTLWLEGLTGPSETSSTAPLADHAQ
jgi:lysophospholipase